MKETTCIRWCMACDERFCRLFTKSREKGQGINHLQYDVSIVKSSLIGLYALVCLQQMNFLGDAKLLSFRLACCSMSLVACIDVFVALCVIKCSSRRARLD